VPETAQVPQTRRALRELERSRAPRRRRARAFEGHVASRQVSLPVSPPSPWITAAAEPAPAPVFADPEIAQAEVLVPEPLRVEASLPAPVPEPVRTQPRRATRASRPAPKRKTHRALSLAAFLFAIGFAVTSVVPMLALGQSATAAAATAAGVQSPRQVQAWRLSMSTQLPAATRDAYTSQLARPSAIFDGAAHDSTFSNNINWAIQWPFPFGVPISYGYGPRIAPMEGASTFHKGIDFDPGAGTPVQIITTGVVEKIVTNPGDSLGVHVVVDHGTIDGHHVESLYCEMAPGSVKVTEGQKVGVGDIVGLVGVSGISTGAHLHFEIHVDGQAVDPAVWLRAHAG
jgi:murein DD-endopeptidase MepM/ murein hydrolase activator NlpD